MQLENNKLVIQKEDTFQASDNLGAIIADFVRKYKEVAVEEHGAPYSIIQQYGFTDDARALEKWNFVLDEIIQAFDPAMKPREDDFNQENGDFDAKEYLIAWDVYTSRHQRGMRLFNKHFKDLWW